MIVFDNKINSLVTELFITGRKLNISLAFIRQSYFAVSENIRLNLTHYPIIKVSNKQELCEIAFNLHQILIFKTLWIFIKNVLQNHNFFVIDTTLASDNSSRFRKNLLKRI